jgi:hypothetical protein
VAFVLGIYGLGRAIGWATRLFDPSANAFAFPAALVTFRFTLTAAVPYELVCTRPSRWGNYFTIPNVEIQVRRLPDGLAQRLRPSFWNWDKRTDMEGNTTQRFADFVADAPGEYELSNPSASQFNSSDKLHIMPSTAGKTLPLVLLFLVSGIATIGGFIVGLIAGLGGLAH